MSDAPTHNPKAAFVLQLTRIMDKTQNMPDTKCLPRVTARFPPKEESNSKSFCISTGTTVMRGHAREAFLAERVTLRLKFYEQSCQPIADTQLAVLNAG